MIRSILSGTSLQILLLVATAGAGAVSYRYYATSAGRLAGAIDNLQSCRQLAARIAEAQQAPQRARLAGRSLEDLGGLVERAAGQAQLGRDRVLRIDPQGARRVARSDYLEQATEVELVGVTLRQLVEFLYSATESDEQLQAGTLRLRTPHGAGNSSDQELWIADVVLTQRIYAPTTTRR